MLPSLLATALAGFSAANGATLATRDSLSTCLSGAGSMTVLTPGQSGFSTAAQSFNRRLSYTPIAITYPTSATQVATVVKCGASNSVAVSARSGGHSYAAFGLGGENGHLIIDLSKMKTVTYDNSTGHAIVQTGNRLGDVASAIWNNGRKRALPHGTCPYVGVGGHTAYGGFGLLGRKYGLLLDTVVQAEVVLANGTVVTASPSSNTDLFWAIRGAAPSFGIVTSWTFATVAAPTSLINYEIDFPTGRVNSTHAVQILQAFQAFALTNPDPNLSALLPVGWTDSSHLNMIIFGTYYGTTTQFKAAIQPLLNSLASIQPTLTQQAPTDYYTGTVYQTGTWDTSTAEPSDTFFAKSITVGSSITSTLNYANWVSWMIKNGGSSSTSLGWWVQIDMYGGFISTVSPSATAYVNRNDVLNFQFYGSKSPFPSSGSGNQNGFTFMNSLVSNLQNPVIHAYPNYIDPTLTTSQWESQYFGDNISRLKQVKNEYDPTNLFRFPQSIPLS